MVMILWFPLDRQGITMYGPLVWDGEEGGDHGGGKRDRSTLMWVPQHSFLAAAPETEPTLQKADMTHVG